jgi:hypothetical protein
MESGARSPWRGSVSAWRSLFAMENRDFAMQSGRPATWRRDVAMQNWLSAIH